MGRGILDHCDDCVRIKTVLIAHNFSDDSLFPSSVALDDSHRLTDLEAFSDMESLGFDLDRFRVLCQKVNVAIMDLLDHSVAVFELTLGNFDTISNLNLKLGVISDSLTKSLIIQEVPLVLVVIIELVKMRLSGWIDLKHFDLLKTWTDVLNNEFGSIEFLIKESVSEHHLSPDIEIFAE